MSDQRRSTDTGNAVGLGRRKYLRLACIVAALAGCSDKKETIPYGFEGYGRNGYG